VSPEGTTLYFDAFGVHTELFVAATTRWYDYIGSGGSMLGVRVLDPNNTVTTRYFQTDNLGSIAVITTRTAPSWSATATTPGASGASPTAPTIRPAA
jgi:hypothetical protein